MLKKSHAALTPGGMVIIHDAHLNADKSGPLDVAAYSVLIVHASEGRCYSMTEMERYLETAGFTGFTFTPGAAGRSIITARKP